MNEEYYLVEGDQKNGPYSFYEITQMDLDIHTEIITGSNDKQQYASELPELNDYFAKNGIYFPTEDNLGGVGQRSVAFLIDYFLWEFLVVQVCTRVGVIKLPANLSFTSALDPSLYMLPFYVLSTFVVYNIICELTLKGSIGKRIFSLVVVDIDGQRITFVQSLLRNIGIVLSIFLVWLPFLSVLFNEHRQAWYDSWAKTYIIKTR